MVSEAAVMGDVEEALRGLGDEVAGFLDAEVAEVFLGRHVEGGFEFTEEATEREVGGFGDGGDGDVFAVVFVKESEGGAEFVVFAEGGDALVEGAGDADDATDFFFLVIKGLFGGGGPVDEAITARDKFDVVNDGGAGFENAEVVALDGFKNASGNEVAVFFPKDVLGLKDFAEFAVIGDVAKVAILDEVDEAGKVVKDPREMILDVVVLEELFLMHGEMLSGKGVGVNLLFEAGSRSYPVPIFEPNESRIFTQEFAGQAEGVVFVACRKLSVSCCRE